MMLAIVLSSPQLNLNEISAISYVAAFGAGILASFTPCVYPLIPVTVGFIGASAAGNRARAFLLSLFYVIGIATTYSCLGAIASLTGRLFGQLSTNPWTYLIVGNIFLILGLSMLGVFTLPLPAFLTGRGTVRKRAGLLGAFLVGVSAGLVVGPCTAPALGAVLTYVATKQNLFFGITLLFTFALGMGMLLMGVGTFAGVASSIPKSGKWLDITKKVFGILLIICAEYFLILAGGRFL
jgi:cytochrome c-type biogenesis protein